jgi:tetratricopeptide (TPR) repeat protein
LSKKSFEHLLAKADQAARNGNWIETRDYLLKAEKIDPRHPGVLTGLGSIWIQLGNPTTAIPFFQRVVKLNPQSAEAYNNLGVGYTLDGRFDEAISAYQKTLELDPEHRLAWKNLAVALLRQERYQEGVEILASLIRANPEDNEALSILAECYEQAGEYTSARLLYEKIVANDPEHSQALEALSRISEIELSNSQIARPEHASKLAILKGLKPTPKQVEPGSNGNSGKKREPLAIAFYGPPEASVEIRMGPVFHALATGGQTVKVGVSFQAGDLDKFDTFIFSRPHADQALVEALKACVTAEKRVIVDLDEDFHNIPQGYPGYETVGPGNPEALRQLDKCLELVSAITLPSQELAQCFSKHTSKITVIPYSWEPSNPMWEKPPRPRKTLNLGVVATHTHPMDMGILGSSLTRVMQEFPDTLLVTGFGMDLYAVLAEVPEDRKLFLPAGRLKDYPYLLSDFDILLFPFMDCPYNKSRSDLPLMEAGARHIPWVATPLAAFKSWEGSGEFANTPEEWVETIVGLLSDASRREQYGERGQALANGRKSDRVFIEWKKFFDQGD